MLHLLFKSEALYLVGLDLCYEKLILIFHIEKIALFEFQKRVFHSLDLNPSGQWSQDTGGHTVVPKPQIYFQNPDPTKKIAGQLDEIFALSAILANLCHFFHLVWLFLCTSC